MGEPGNDPNEVVVNRDLPHIVVQVKYDVSLEWKMQRVSRQWDIVTQIFQDRKGGDMKEAN